MKKRYFCLVFVFTTIFAFAQAPIDLFDPFYDDLNIWKTTGLINDCPDVRPYPLQEIKRILDIVIKSGTPNQVRRAKEYQERFFNTSFHFGGMTSIGIDLPKKTKALTLSPFAEMNLKLSEILTASAHVNFSLLTKLPKEEPVGKFLYSNKDFASDQSKVGRFKVLPMFNSGVTIGNPEYYFTAGMARTSFGPFADNNLIVGRQAFHAGQFIFVVNKEKFTYNQVLLCLSSTNYQGKGREPEKFFASHMLSYRPLPWISVGIFDSMIYGGRFEPIYLAPFSAFFIGQSIYSFPDNSTLGLTASVKPIKGLKLDMVLLADDLGFNEIIKFKKSKWRMAGQFGVSYAMPKDHWFSMADLNYTMVTPYCYTHVDNKDPSEPNYQNYTHNGEPLGSNLEPNSDRISLKVKFRPAYGLDIDVYNNFIRHANITESITDPETLKHYFEKQYATDGSVFNHATVVYKHHKHDYFVRDHAFLYSTPFLTQKTIQYVNQLGFDMVFHFPILKSGGNMQCRIGYMFEANINDGVNENIYEYDSTFAAITNPTKAKILEERDRQLKEWRDNAKSKAFNHYLNLSVKIAY